MRLSAAYKPLNSNFLEAAAKMLSRFLSSFYAEGTANLSGSTRNLLTTALTAVLAEFESKRY